MDELLSILKYWRRGVFYKKKIKIKKIKKKHRKGKRKTVTMHLIMSNFKVKRLESTDSLWNKAALAS